MPFLEILRLGRALAAVVFVCLTVACASEPPVVDVTAELDGSFTAALGPGTTLGGNEIPDTKATVTWVARSTCRDTGCVATATEVAADAGGPRPPTMVFDFIDGRWISVREVPSECVNSKGESITVQGWQTYVLEPKDDGTLGGTYTNRSSVGGACHNSTQAVTLTRTGDGDNTAVEVADPGTEPAPEASPATALWGEYRQVQTNPQSGQVYPPTTYVGTTACLRTAERCLTYLVDPDSKAILVMTFADGQWTSTSAPIDSTCPDGTPATSTLTGEFALPQPLTDPITTLAGTQRTEQTGTCENSLTLDVTLTRIGDGTGRTP